MRSSIISLSLATIIGVVIGLLLQSPKSPQDASQHSLQADSPLTNTNTSSTSPSTENKTPQLAELSQQLQEEIIARQALQKEVSALSQKLAALGPKEESEKNLHTTTSANSTNRNPTGRANTAWFNQQALIDAGMDKSEAEKLKTQFEELELAKLYLRDKAVREGWARSKRFRTEREQLDAQTDGIKEEFGEEVYDAYLYAAGQSNRVAVQSVLSGSAAGNAGLNPGDQITRYNGKRIYNWRDLRDATTEGDISETVAVEIIRDGKTTEYYVPRGPLGIRMTSVSVAP